MKRLALVGLAAALATASVARAQESTAAACQNGVDDDGDGWSDCADQDCSVFVFCAQAQPLTPAAAPSSGSHATVEGSGYATAGPHAAPSGGRPNFVLAGIGAALWAAAWVADWSVSLAIVNPAVYPESLVLSFVPIIGPWGQLGCCAEGSLQAALAVLDGVVQIAGLTMLIIGLSIREGGGTSARRRDGPFSLAGGTPTFRF
jgi:hypothetical protein